MKSCIIGNSHLIAIKEALALHNPLGEAPTYVFAPGAELAIEIASGTIVSTARSTRIVTPEGNALSKLKISDYDAFIIILSGITAGQVLRINRTYRLWKHLEAGKKVLSRAVFTAATAGLMLESTALDVARRLRAETEAPILLVTLPQPPNKLKTVELETPRHHEIYERWQPMFDEDMGADLYDIYVNAARMATAEIRCCFIEQPADTRAPVLSGDEFQAQSRTVFESPGRENEIEDLSHMNSKYGQLIVRDIRAALDAMN